MRQSEFATDWLDNMLSGDSEDAVRAAMPGLADVCFGLSLQKSLLQLGKRQV